MFTPFVLTLAALPGCFVEGRCLSDVDCAKGELCVASACEPCRTAADCAAMRDENPYSPTLGQEIRLAAWRGDVVLVYLANPT